MAALLPKFSRVGFGSYRVALGVEEHEKALRKALTMGINVIDTSTNYADGKSEELIGKVLHDMQSERKLRREDVVLVSKAGYIQGSNLKRMFEPGYVQPPELVMYQRDCFHCIHPDFLRDQLERSLQRLRTPYLDVFLLHNPEYYLMKNITGPRDDGERHRRVMLDRIGRAFEALEREVARGRIRSYGISCNSFGKPDSDPHHVPYRPLLPANLLERAALEPGACVDWAASNGLRVIVNRPLNAFSDTLGSFRLASYPPAVGYQEALDAALKRVEYAFDSLPESSEEDSELDQLKDAITQIDRLRPHFQSYFHFESALYRSIIPALRRLVEEVGGTDGNFAPDMVPTGVPEYSGQHVTDQYEEGEKLGVVVQRFLDAYVAQVKYELGKRAGDRIRELGFDYRGTEEGGETLQRYALRWLLGHRGVSSVLLGMRSEGYVDDAASLLRPEAGAAAAATEAGAGRERTAAHAGARSEA
eukprot:tig00000498_g1580.t1